MKSEEDIRKRLLESTNSIRVKVRFNDTDAMGVVHFKNYLVYSDDGFVSFMNSLADDKRIEETLKEKLVFAVRHIDVSYENSVAFGDYVIVETNVKKIGNKSITFHHKISKESNNDLLAEAEFTRIIMDLKTKKLVKVIDYLTRYLG